MNPGTFWGAAAISVVIVSWFFYRAVVPKSWKEWARAGMVQAFIIAFYAEMYGFPLTIYALTRLFGLDVSGTFWDGNLWIYLTGTRAAMLVSMVLGSSHRRARRACFLIRSLESLTATGNAFASPRSSWTSGRAVAECRD